MLIGHETNLAGSEIFLLTLGELLEQSGGIVRLLFIEEKAKGLILKLHEERGHSYLVKNRTQEIDFNDFDVIIPNTVAIEMWFGFFERASTYLSKNEMQRLLKKTIYWIHEYDPKEWDIKYLKILLPKVNQVLFDSHAGRAQWVEVIPEISNNSGVVWPGISKERSEQLINDKRDKQMLRKKLKIDAEEDDLIFLQVGTISEVISLTVFNSKRTSLTAQQLDSKQNFAKGSWS